MIVSDVTGVDVEEALRIPNVIVLASPDWAIADPSAQSFVATGEGRTRMSTSMLADAVTVLVLSLDSVAVLVTTVPSVNGVSTGRRMPMSTWRDAPAGIPVLPVGLGGAGRGIVNTMVNVRVGASNVTVRSAVVPGSDVTSKPAGSTSTIVASMHASVSEEQLAISR